MRVSDWSSDVCSSDLAQRDRLQRLRQEPETHHHPRQRAQTGPQPRPALGVLQADGPGHLEQPGHHQIDPSHEVTPPRKKKRPGAFAPDRRRSSCAGSPRRRVVPRSEEHTYELQSLMRISYAVFCLKKKIKIQTYLIYIYIHSTT